MSVLISIFLLMGLACVWGLVCNNRTYHDRGKLIDLVVAKDLSWDKYTRVDYDTHMWYLFSFRDATKLYPEEMNWKK
jgi:hypothetical protein